MIRFDNLPPEVVQAMCTPMHQIISASSSSGGTLYLGSMSALVDTDLLRAHHITHLVQVLDVSWLPVSEKDGFKCYRIDIVDLPTAELSIHLEGACSWIEGALRSGGNVLVHCQQGVSRSASIVIAFLIRSYGMNYDTAFALVKRKRPCIKPNPGFVRCLQEWDRKMRPAITRRQTAA